MARRNLDENSEASLRSARYRLDRDIAEELPLTDEYAQRTGKTLGDTEEALAAIPRFLAEDEVWEAANSALDAAFARGEFDNLAYAGKPIPGLGSTTDPDWWVKGLIEREKITGLGPPALMLRKEDDELEGTLDRLSGAAAVRALLEDFNARVIDARRQLLGGTSGNYARAGRRGRDRRMEIATISRGSGAGSLGCAATCQVARTLAG